MLIDIGANLTHESFAADLAQVLKRAREANVGQMVVTGSDLEESRAAIALATEYPQCLTATAGIHPHYAAAYDADAHQQLLNMVNMPEVRAIGETGLDYFRDISPRESQQKSFIAHLDMAADSAKPVFLHQREAHDDFLAILQEYRNALTKVVVHCFTDSREALIYALNDFQGAVLLITHDVYLAEATADQLWLVKDGKATRYDGDLQDYRALVLRADRDQAEPKPKKNKSKVYLICIL